MKFTKDGVRRMGYAARDFTGYEKESRFLRKYDLGLALGEMCDYVVQLECLLRGDSPPPPDVVAHVLSRHPRKPDYSDELARPKDASDASKSSSPGGH